MMSNRRSLARTGVLIVALVALGSASAWAQPNLTYSGIAFDILDYDRIVVRLTTAEANQNAVDPEKIEFGFKAVKSESTTGFGLAAPDMTFSVDFTTHGPYTKEATGLKPATNYLIGIRGVDDDSKQAWHYRDGSNDGVTTPVAATGTGTDSYAMTQAAPAPGRVEYRDVMVTPGDGTLMLAWKAPSAGTGLAIENYKVAFSTEKHADADVASKAMMWPFTSSKPEAAISGLTNDTMYYVWIKAVNSGGAESEKWSEPVSGTPGMTATPALPLFGAFALGTGLLAAGRARLRNRRALRVDPAHRS